MEDWRIVRQVRGKNFAFFKFQYLKTFGNSMFINNKFEKKNIRNISIITKTIKWKNFKDVCYWI